MTILTANEKARTVTVRIEDTCDGLLINAEDMAKFNLRQDIQYPGEMLADGRFRINLSALAEAPAPDVAGVEPVAWQQRWYVGGMWLSWKAVDGSVSKLRDDFDFNVQNGTLELRPLYSADLITTLSARVAELERERDEARTEIAGMEASYASAIQEMSERFRAVNISRVIEQSGVNFLAQATKLEVAEAKLAAAAFTPTHRHKRRGGTYCVIARGRMQIDGDLDDEVMIVYRGENGMVWVRPAYEFEDGRFEEIDGAAPTSPLVGEDRAAPSGATGRLAALGEG